MLMSFDTRITWRLRMKRSCSAHHADDLVVALDRRQARRAGRLDRLGLQNSLPLAPPCAEGLRALCPPRWSPRRAADDLVDQSGSPGARCARPRTCPSCSMSSSSSVIIGTKMSCSSKRNRLVGSCISTLVSSTNSLRVDDEGRTLDAPDLAAVHVLHLHDPEQLAQSFRRDRRSARTASHASRESPRATSGCRARRRRPPRRPRGTRRAGRESRCLRSCSRACCPSGRSTGRAFARSAQTARFRRRWMPR
jgi:hypothetical protein